MGSSANSAETTLVVLESAPHETQSILQNSLPLTPGECKQEAADGVVTAGRTNGTAQSANPPEMDVDVNRTALLGGELAERARRVDEGDEMEHGRQSQLQQTNFYCKESCQRNGNANRNIHNAYRLPLVGEWDVYASGKMANSNGDADASNTAVERMYGPSELKKTKDAMENELRGCEGGTSE